MNILGKRIQAGMTLTRRGEGGGGSKPCHLSPPPENKPWLEVENVVYVFDNSRSRLVYAEDGIYFTKADVIIKTKVANKFDYLKETMPFSLMEE